MVDSIGEKIGVNIFNEKGDLIHRSSNTAPAGYKGSYSAEFGVPIKMRTTWRIDGPEVKGVIQNPVRVTDNYWDGYVGGILVGDYTAPVAERIPEALLNDIPKYRKSGMGFRLKIRLHDEGVLIGWDIANIVDRVHVGGDFEEAHMIYEGDRKNPTKRWVNGWYIHPRTKQRIETDF